MFERYTEPARRVIFFARYEASQLGGHAIDTEHLLLGLLREGVGTSARILRDAGVSSAAARKEVEARALPGQPISTSVDIPLTAAVKRVLEHAAEEADRSKAEHIGPEHFLVGLLRERETVAGEILAAHGVRLDEVREALRLAPSGASGTRLPQAFEQLVEFLKELDERRARYHVSLFRPNGLRVEIGLAEERWTATFFPDGRVTVEVFWLSSDVRDERSLKQLLDRIGPKG